MKRIWLFLLLLVVYVSFASFVFAQERPDQEVLAAVTEAKKVNYALPYPGILPDNPLYFLKTFRDKLIKFLISDPVKKADFLLLTSDKRLAAAGYLFKKNKSKIALDTISKSANYFSESLSKVKEAKSLGKNLGDLPQKINLSLLKHDEVLTEFIGSADNSFKVLILSEQKRLLSLENDVKMLIEKP